MTNAIVVKDIDSMRRQGINDVELQRGIRELRIGDFVKLTLLTRTGPCAGETLLVRITRTRSSRFDGQATVA
ncbi:MAG TPA: hypothetical protein VKU02_08930 [Gemmataceae bacterium]|nr:hypothetical protein [Gemmataceae bacterium]